jgi:putative ABC transport system permease protein
MAFAAFIFTVLICVPASMDRVISDASGTLRLVVSNSTAPWGGVPANYCPDVMRLPGALSCVAIRGWLANYQSVSEPIFSAACGPELADVFPDYRISREQRDALTRNRRGAVVGEVLMRKYGWKIGQAVTLRGVDAGHLDLTFIIVGVIKSKHYPNVLTFRLDYLAEASRAGGYDTGGLVWYLMVRASKPRDLALLAKRIDAQFRNSAYETRTSTESDFLAAGVSELGNVRQISLGLCLTVLVTVLLIAVNSAAMVARERTGEVAVLRALGFSRSKIMTVLYGEGIAITLVGSTIGACFALFVFGGGVTLGSVLNGSGALWVTGPQALSTVVVMVAATALSALLPIERSIRCPPAIALRQIF